MCRWLPPGKKANVPSKIQLSASFAPIISRFFNGGFLVGSAKNPAAGLVKKRPTGVSKNTLTENKCP
jgi:hypothetical protein